MKAPALSLLAKKTLKASRPPNAIDDANRKAASRAKAAEKKNADLALLSHYKAHAQAQSR